MKDKITKARIRRRIDCLYLGNDGDSQAFMLALKNVVEAQGGIGHLSKRTGLDRAHLYRIYLAKEIQDF